MKSVKIERIKPAHSDNRRTLTPMFNGNFNAKQIKILDINSGNYLGNHFHTYKEMFYIKKGLAIYTFEDVNTKEKKSYLINAGTRIIIQPYIAHKALFLSDSEMIEATECKYYDSETNDKPYKIKTKW